MRKVLLCLLCLPFFTSCEDVIEVDTPTEAPRLVLDAFIRIDTSQGSFPVKVQARETSDFFSENQPAALEQITISNEANEFLVLEEMEPGSGVYQEFGSPEFFTKGELVLQVAHKGERYIARTRYVPVVPLDTIRQGDGTLFSGDETEVVVTYTDPGATDDYYLFDFDFGEYLVSEDEFYQGQTFSFSYFYDKNLEAGQEVEISILGITEAFYNYMNQVIVQSGSDSAGPFQTPAATVRGNIFNVTELDNEDVKDNTGSTNNFALGYFAVSQEFTRSLLIEE